MKKEITKKSNSLKLKLKAYTTLVISAIALDSSAQIIYTDIPDTTLVNDNEFFDIDFNNDGSPEFNLTLNTFFSSRGVGSLFFNGQINILGINPRNGNVVIDSNSYPAGFNFNDLISLGSNSFSSGNRAVVFHTFISSNYNSGLYQNSKSNGNFLGVEKYLGVRFTIGSNQHYGWIRLDVSTRVDSVTIKDFAYDSTANAPILAGDRGALVGLRTNSFQKTDFYSSHNQLNFRGQIPANTQLSIIDLKGQKVKEAFLTENQRKQELSSFSNGIYVVEIRNGKSVLRKKMWLEAN
jgi:hypothetical protein